MVLSIVFFFSFHPTKGTPNPIDTHFSDESKPPGRFRIYEVASVQRYTFLSRAIQLNVWKLGEVLGKPSPVLWNIIRPVEIAIPCYSCRSDAILDKPISCCVWTCLDYPVSERTSTDSTSLSQTKLRLVRFCDLSCAVNGTQ